jgi:hypothetical protein
MGLFRQPARGVPRQRRRCIRGSSAGRLPHPLAPTGDNLLRALYCGRSGHVEAERSSRLSHPASPSQLIDRALVVSHGVVKPHADLNDPLHESFGRSRRKVAPVLLQMLMRLEEPCVEADGGLARPR